MRTGFRIAGFGGQGIVLAGAILGEAAVIAGMEAVQTQSYGPESRGGAARSEVVIADGPVDYPRVVDPDVLVVLSTEAMKKYAPALPKSGVCVVDTDLVQTDLEGVTRVPFTMTAEAVGRKIVANIVMLGYITHRFGVVPRKDMEAAIRKRIPKGTEKLNMEAFQAGWDLFEGGKGTVRKGVKKEGGKGTKATGGKTPGKAARKGGKKVQRKGAKGGGR